MDRLTDLMFYTLMIALGSTLFVLVLALGSFVVAEILKGSAFCG